MRSSRYNRTNEGQLISRTAKFTIATLVLLLCMFFFGPTIVIRLTSIFATTKKGDEAQKEQVIFFPPALDPLPQATNSASLTLHGTGTAGMHIQFSHNGKKAGETTIKDDGTFTLGPLKLIDGENTFTARTVKDQTESEDSEAVHIAYKKSDPEITITSPQQGSTIREEKNQISIEGSTDAESTVTINDRVVVVRGDGSFSYLYKPSKGENKIKMKVVDIAGNETEKEFSFTYDP